MALEYDEDDEGGDGEDMDPLLLLTRPKTRRADFPSRFDEDDNATAAAVAAVVGEKRDKKDDGAGCCCVWGSVSGTESLAPMMDPSPP
eukprot:CAMPEP_0198299360 /NCGR_PEP_ID=MMETSP1449-20131203/44457_1 /TAXON_ID=420275 /ORGANISM="Attheya septentrionalis, Strain CCMP2084" /LENGTH=87 /DNA_ID=CAMNT_0044000899 /DNA_START=56 /DNA_END=320 /DNA_ORIENTATION=-